MKKTLLVLSLLGCLLLSAVACTNNESDSNTGTLGASVDGNIDLDQPGDEFGETETSGGEAGEGDEDDKGDINIAGDDTDNRWGPIIRPNG